MRSSERAPSTDVEVRVSRENLSEKKGLTGVVTEAIPLEEMGRQEK
jgi:hypothetical protein